MPHALIPFEDVTQVALRGLLAVALAVGAIAAASMQPTSSIPLGGAALVSTAFPVAQAQFARGHATVRVAEAGS